MFWIGTSSRGVEIQWQELFQLFHICCDQLITGLTVSGMLQLKKECFMRKHLTQVSRFQKCPTFSLLGKVQSLFTQASLKNISCPQYSDSFYGMRQFWLLWSLSPFYHFLNVCLDAVARIYLCNFLNYATYSRKLVNPTEKSIFGQM